jgi:sugar phosphate isomerase/epimerase
MPLSRTRVSGAKLGRPRQRHEGGNDVDAYPGLLQYEDDLGEAERPLQHCPDLLKGRNTGQRSDNLLSEVNLTLSRRQYIRQSPVFLVAASFTSRALGNTEGHPDISFPVQPRERLSVTSWPFREYFKTSTNRNRDSSQPGMDMKDFPKFVRDTFGIPNINPLRDHFSSTDSAYLEAFNRAVDDAKSKVVDLGLGGKPFYNPDKSARDAAVAFGHEGIDLAVAVRSPSVRQHVSGPAGLKPDSALAAESLGRLAEYGAKRNVIVNLENDHPVAEDPFFLAEVLHRVNNPYLRGLPDMGNSLVGHDEDYNERGVRAMFKYAYSMCHVKDVLQGDGKQYRVNLARMFEIAKASGYRGYYSMEFDTGSGDAVAGTKRLAKETLKFLS